MGTPRIYWYPDDSGTLETLDLGEGLTDLQEEHAGEVSDAYTVGGPYRTLHRPTLRVRIILERFGTWGVSLLERNLLSLHSHLLAGGAVGFSRDHARTWAALTASVVSRGDTLLYTSGNGFTAWSSSANLVATDEIVVESAPPDARRELLAVTTLTSGQFVCDRAARYTHVSKPIVRWRDFYPLLTWPADQVGRPLAAHDHRRNWTLDLTLEYSIGAAVALWDADYDTAYDRATSGVIIGGDQAVGVPLRDDTAAGGWGGRSLAELGPGRNRTHQEKA